MIDHYIKKDTNMELIKINIEETVFDNHSNDNILIKNLNTYLNLIISWNYTLFYYSDIQIIIKNYFYPIFIALLYIKLLKL